MTTRSTMRSLLGLSILTTAALTATIALAQMDNGPKTENTYGIGLPRDHASQLFSDADYPVFPLKPGQEAYKDIDGARMKRDIIALSDIALAYRDNVNKQWWGRFPGTDADKAGMKYMTDEFTRLGLKVETFPYKLPRDWRPTSWELSYTSSKDSKIDLATAFPVSGTKGTAEGITAEAVWVGIGAAPDFLGRDVEGQGGHHLQHLRARRPQPFGLRPRRPVQRQRARPTAWRRHGDQCHGRAGQRPVPARGRAAQHSADDVSQDEGFALRDRLGAGEKITVTLRLDRARSSPTSRPPGPRRRCPARRTKEIVVMTHTDGYFQAATDNNSRHGRERSSSRATTRRCRRRSARARWCSSSSRIITTARWHAAARMSASTRPTIGRMWRSS